MSGTSEADDGLDFLHNRLLLHRRQDRWRLDSLRLGHDAAALAGVFLLGLAVTYAVPAPFRPETGAALAACLAAAIAAAQLGRSGAGLLGRVVMQAAAAAAIGGGVLLLCGTPLRADLAWSVREAIAAAVLLAALGAVLDQAIGRLRAEGRLATHVALIGTGPAASRLRAEIEAGSSGLLKVVGCYAPDDDALPAALALRGTLRTLLSDCRQEFVDAVVLALEPGAAGTLQALRQALRVCVQDVYADPALVPLLGEAAPAVSFGSATLALIERRPLSGAAGLAKRSFDAIGALTLIAIMAPLLALISVAIRLDSRGPILFRQLRVGYNNRLFFILKFRSMHAAAADPLAKQQTVHGDPRITRVGRVIRRMSLDELPQLFNVVRGEMSLVGPRPHAPGTSIGSQRVHKLLDGYARRHLVRPGITGLAQVRGLRGGLHEFGQVANRIAADLEYIERWSLWLDIRILLGTVLHELRNSRGI